MVAIDVALHCEFTLGGVIGKLSFSYPLFFSLSSLSSLFSFLFSFLSSFLRHITSIHYVNYSFSAISSSMIDEAMAEIESPNTKIQAPTKNLTPLFVSHGKLDTSLPLAKAKQHV